MARSSSKILIVTTDENNYDRILQSLKNTIPDHLENRIIHLKQDISRLPDLESESLGLLILDLPLLTNELEHILLLLDGIGNDIPSLIIFSEEENTHIRRLLENRDFVYLIPSEWLESELLESYIRRIFNNTRMKHEIDEQLRAKDSLLQNLPGMVFQCVDDEQWTMKYVGSGCKELTGYDEMDLVENHIVSYNDLILPEDREMVRNSIQEAIDRKEHYKIIYRIVDAWGKKKWVWEMGNSYQSVAGSERFLEGFITDITKEVELKNLLQESEERSKNIIQHMHEGVMLTDENGIVINWNEKMDSLVALHGSEVIGKSIFNLLERIINEKIILVDEEHGRRFFNDIYGKNFIGNFHREWEGEVLSSKREYSYCQIEIFTINTPQGNRLVVIARDIDDRKKHEKELQFLVELAAAIRSSSNNVTTIQSSVLDILMNLLGAQSIALAIFHDNNEFGKIVEVRGLPVDRIGKVVSWSNCVNQGPLYQESVYQICERCAKQLFSGVDSDDLPQTRISVPIMFGSNKIGIIFIMHNDQFSNYEYRLMGAVSNIVASALNQVLLFQQTELRLKRLESLHVIDQAISGLFNLELTNRIILDQAKQQLSADAGDILILNMATNVMEYSANYGLKYFDTEEKRVHISRSMAGHILLTREPCIIPDISTVELPFIMKHLERQGFKAYFGFPLIAKGEPKGVIEIYMQQPFHPNAEWLNFLQSLATQTGIAIDNIQLFEKMQFSRFSG